MKHILNYCNRSLYLYIAIGGIILLNTNVALLEFQRSKYLRSCWESNPSDIHTAILYFENMTRIVPENPEIWASLGMAQIQLREFDQATISFKKAVSLDPKRVLYRLTLSSLEELQRRRHSGKK